MRQRPITPTLAVAALLAAAALGGCGGDDAPSGAPDGTAATATPQSTPSAQTSQPATEEPEGSGSGAASSDGQQGGSPEETVLKYLKALARGDADGCRLFTDEGLARFTKLTKRQGSDLQACESIFEASRELNKGAIEVGGRRLKPDQLDDLKLEVERKPGAQTALVAGPGGLARVELVDGQWRISSIESTG